MTKEIGQKLRILRRERRLTQQDLADHIGMNRATISNYEIGRRSPNISELRKLAEYFGVGLDFFGVTPKDNILDLIGRAKTIFEDENISAEKKRAVYEELMRLYLAIK